MSQLCHVQTLILQEEAHRSCAVKCVQAKPAAGVSAAAVKDLRAKSGAGMMECKKALVEADGDFDKVPDSNPLHTKRTEAAPPSPVYCSHV